MTKTSDLTVTEEPMVSAKWTVSSSMAGLTRQFPRRGFPPEIPPQTSNETAERGQCDLKVSRSLNTRIAINKNGQIFFINTSDVLTVIAQGNYVLLECASHTLRLRESISVMTEKLAPYGFVRIHRSVLVNRTYVQEIRPSESGKYLVHLTSAKEFATTRTYRKNLKSLAEVWLGDETLVSD